MATGPAGERAEHCTTVAPSGSEGVNIILVLNSHNFLIQELDSQLEESGLI